MASAQLRALGQPHGSELRARDVLGLNAANAPCARIVISDDPCPAIAGPGDTQKLALLLSVNPKWVIFGAIGLYVGSFLWEVGGQEHADEMAERERLS